MKEFFLIAEVRAIYNSDGYLRLESFSDFPERFSDLQYVYIDIFGVKKKVVVEDSGYVGKNTVIKFLNFDTAEDVRIFLKKKIYVESSNAVLPDQQSYFIHDLIGLKVFQDELFFGELIDVIQMTANDIYVIKDVNGNNHLLPAVSSFIKSIELDDGKITITNYDGSLKDNEN